jgi:hypothetical protein
MSSRSPKSSEEPKTMELTMVRKIARDYVKFSEKNVTTFLQIAMKYWSSTTICGLEKKQEKIIVYLFALILSLSLVPTRNISSNPALKGAMGLSRRNSTLHIMFTSDETVHSL